MPWIGLDPSIIVKYLFIWGLRGPNATSLGHAQRSRSNTWRSGAPHKDSWPQDPKGVWVANNHFYRIGGVWAHESCTKMNTATINTSGSCAYWTNGSGGMFKGYCTVYPGQVFCL
ncbi:hypothetical protein B0I37DRAFT_351054 [Chaetomium sp. MPI-CAGE-AT-0009]|nr:hypothetical protein B0I37DRAFT_351054 [Chaetomium sp. MPI-CAGE-AT-0009]